MDILYCGAGGNFEPTRDFSDIDEQYWRQTLNNTITSLYNLSHSVRPVMREGGGGAIVSIAASHDRAEDQSRLERSELQQVQVHAEKDADESVVERPDGRS